MTKLIIFIFLTHCIVFQSFSQSEISGTVLSNSGEILPGATVTVKGTNIGTTSDFDGEFSLTKVPKDAVLSVRFIGYIAADIHVNNQTFFKITLKEDLQSLDEIVIVGYGTQTKRDLTGAVGSVKVADLALAPTSSFDQALTGRLAGVQVTSSDGTPGGAANIVIRGGNSITGDNSPLYVIDGVPLVDFDASTLNTNDIKSLDVLKDASSTAIYGSRGANGVILITTKSGRSDGKTEISLRVNSGIQYTPGRLEVMNPFQYVSYLEQQALISDGYTPGSETTQFRKTWLDPELYRNMEGTSWQNEILQVSSFQDYTLSVSGGSETTQFYYSGQYLDQEGILINTGFNKAVNNLRVTHEVSDRVKVDASMIYSLSNQTGSTVDGNGYSGNVIRDALVFRPVEPINNDGFEGFDLDDEASRFLFNPVDNLNNTERIDRRELFRGTLNGRFEINTNLSLNAIGSFQSLNRRRSLFNGENTYQGTRGNNGISGEITNVRNTVSTGSGVLNYAPKLGSKQKLKILGGIEAQTRTLEESSLSSSQIPTDVFGIDNLGLGLVSQIPTTVLNKNTLMSYFGRINYSLKNRYLLTVNFRADGSSKFRKDNRWGYFPSFSLGWVISDEPLFKEIDFISNLKFRGGWGKTGNNRIGDFDAFTTLASTNSSGYVWGIGENYAVGATVNNLGVPNLRWETTSQYNAGFDFSILKSRVQGSIDYYLKRTEDLLLNANMASSTGFERVQQNVGEVENSGIEISLQSFNVSNKNFEWDTNFNISFNRNKVIKLNQGQDAFFTDPERVNLGEFQYITKVGQPVGQIYGLQHDGLYQLDDFNWNNSLGVYELKDGIPDNGSQPGPGSVKFVDVDKDGTITEDDRGIIGNTAPKFVGGLTNVFKYKGFDLQLFMQFSYGSEVLNLNRVELESPSGTRQNGLVALYNQWTPSNPDTDIHAYVYNNNFGRPVRGTRISDLYVEDGSFLRLKTVSLGYNLDKKFLSNGFVKSVRFFVTAQNLFTWTNYSGYDPEVSVSPRGGISKALAPNLDWSAYPQSITITSGINMTF
ncbi:SusC/RagA family TonB-linked outer membrane protein [Mariniflexile ostreae]|uniref:SusC/RagA family TonB-linked outer membrane protein n=1 Tax=Mariniflexile ostreae TaxID=1520892 RepID=A0ABV5FEE0_9FLAO